MKASTHKVVNALPASLEPDSVYYVRRGTGFDVYVTTLAGVPISQNRDIIFPLSGQWLLDPNEMNGWGVLGPYDNSNTQDLGNVGD